eukprot:CAMPEP_0116141928 /NCGR_PEP_ID=MMETSP0329-20121206/14637_1 /TAXON_ID=697910 /ORGANISM="Pseudo-nitzschia arenysensis, Strain B593" /LENGTH=360 /DNA_ID=CAMNT_0003637131 /DNA_START=168 /DNA_END=1246 /DNA_ORIENTATION=-
MRSYCVKFPKLLIVSLLAPSAKCLFGSTRLSSQNGIIDNHDFCRHDNPIRSSQKSHRQNEINPIRQAAKVQENIDVPLQSDEGLVFEGEFNYQSDVVPMPTSAMSSPAKDLFDFFSDPKNRDLVIKGGGNPCESIPLTPELQNEWTSQSKIVKSTPPNGNVNGKNEEILAVYSEVPIVPGLSLRAVSYTGCKTMKEPTSALPYYEFTLLKESYQPVGKKAMTWIFDKVTGNKKKNISNEKNEENKGENRKGITTDHTMTGKKDGVEVTAGDSSSRKTYALSRVMLKPCPQDGGCKICYYGHVRLTLSKRFLHMLPLPTKVVQAKVNKSIRKQLECECSRSMQKFTGALNRWNEQFVKPST